MCRHSATAKLRNEQAAHRGCVPLTGKEPHEHEAVPAMSMPTASTQAALSPRPPRSLFLATLVLTVNPDSGRSNPTTFRPDALCEFIIASDGGTREDRAFRMSFGELDADGNQEMQVRYAVGRPSRPGLDGTDLGPAIRGKSSC